MPADSTADRLHQFPKVPEAAARGPMYRIFLATDPATGKPRDAWHFSGLPCPRPGRFDLPAPDGTCHLATRAHGAWLEVFRGTGLVDRIDVERRHLLRASPVGSPPDLADLRAPAARGFGVTADLAAGDDYRQPQHWAHDLRGAGFDGLRAALRHDPSGEVSTVALFGRAGSRSRVRGWSGTVGRVLADATLLGELHRFGTGVADRPWDVPASSRA